MRLNFWSKKRAVESEFEWNPAPKYRMSSYAWAILYDAYIIAMGGLGVWAWGFACWWMAAVSGIVALIAIRGLVLDVIKLDKEYQEDNKRAIGLTQRADDIVYDLHRMAPHWPLEDIKHFVRSRIYP